MNFAKVGDVALGICVCAYPPYPATGSVVTGSPNFLEAGIPIAIMNSMVTFPCGTSLIIATDFNWIDIGLPLARTGDQVVGCGMGTVIGSSMHIHL